MTTPTTIQAQTHVRIAIIGSGFGGIGAAIRLKQDGETDFVILERAEDCGGTWRDNSYPGCACDVQSHLYSFSFALNPNWSRSYSPQQEIWDYLREVAARYGLTSNFRYGRNVVDMSWDDDACHWRIVTAKETYTADIVVSAAGALSDPSIPKIPGLASFEGETFHSAQWNHDFDLRGRKIAVVGTGASAIQFVPAIQPKVAKLSLFQRTPPWILPRRDRAIGSLARSIYRTLPFTQKATRAGIYAARELMALGFMHPRVMQYGERLARLHLARSVRDPELRKKLTPNYTIGCKRVLLSDDYYPALAKENVDVVTTGIREVTPKGIVTDDGVLHEVDAIIFGTGFLVTDIPIAKHVRGRDGRTLYDVWGGSPKAHLGTTVAGFPNLFFLLGPNTGLGHTSVVVMIEGQIELLRKAVAHMRKTGSATIEPTRAAQEEFVAYVDQKLGESVWNTGGCASWYLDHTGRNSTLWPGFTFAFLWKTARFHARDYVFGKKKGASRERSPRLPATTSVAANAASA